ncbi:MAG: HAD family hydrolase [Actinomycetota bacterium]
MFASIKSRVGLDADPNELVAECRRRVVELTEPVRGAEECLTSLRAAGRRLAIVSNSSSRQQHAKIDRLGLRHRVDAVIVSGDHGVAKPDRRLFDLAAEQAEGSLEQAVMVGDSPLHDIEAAATLGLDTAWIRRDRTWPGAIEPTHTVDDLTEVASLLLT